MASRLPHPPISRPTLPMDGSTIKSFLPRIRAWRLPVGADLTLLLFRIATLPFWLGSDIPAPTIARRDPPLADGGRAGNHVARQFDLLVRRIWWQRILSVLFRTLWLPILVGCIWLTLELAGIAELRMQWLPWIGLGLAFPALLFAFLIRPSRRDVARMLDRSYDLQDRMVTALEHIGDEVPLQGEAASITYLQVADAANIVTVLRTRPVFHLRPPVREIVLGIAFALIFASLFFLRGHRGDIPTPVENAVPEFVPAAVRLAAERPPESQVNAAVPDAPTKADVQAKSERSNQAQQDLKKLASALADQAVTRSAAEAIQEGDYAAAADLLREVAENADQLSQSTREGLADDLDAAADAMSPGSESLAEAARDAADGLREGGEAAKTELNDLGDAVDQTASDIVSQSELASELQQAEASSSSSSRGQSGDSASGEAQDASEPSEDESDAGDASSSGGNSSGADAQPGDAKSDQSGSTEGSNGSNDEGGQDGEGSQSEGNSNSPSDQGDAGKSASQSGSGETAGNAPPAPNADDNNEVGASGEGGDPGAGAGSGGSNEGELSDSASQDSSGATSDGSTASDPNLTEGDGGNGEGTTAEADGHSSITLARSDNAGGVQTSSSGGAATSGSGGGASMSGGTGSQGDVGVAGPDSNRVPAEYRSIVEDYFPDQEGS